MTTSNFTAAEALNDLSQIKHVLNETTMRVSKLYLFFYGVLIIYVLPILSSLLIYMIPTATLVKHKLLMFQGYMNIFFPLLLIPLFLLMKLKILPKSNVFAHKLLHIWMFGFIVIFFGFTFIQLRFSYFLQSYMQTLEHFQVNEFSMMGDILYGFNYMLPFLAVIVLLFIYLMMNLLTNKKGFLVGCILNLIAYSLTVWLFPNSSSITKLSFIQILIGFMPSVLLIINLLIMAGYFKKTYQLERMSHEH